MTLNEDELQTVAIEQMDKIKVRLINFLDRYYGKPYVLDCRVKSLEKLKLKQALFFEQMGHFVELTDLPDIIGFRISVENEIDVEELSNLINNKLRPSRVIDYFNTPRETGFKAFLYYFDDMEINTEIQIMTVPMMEWTNATHEEHNKRKYGC